MSQKNYDNVGSLSELLQRAQEPKPQSLEELLKHKPQLQTPQTNSEATPQEIVRTQLAKRLRERLGDCDRTSNDRNRQLKKCIQSLKAENSKLAQRLDSIPTPVLELAEACCALESSLPQDHRDDYLLLVQEVAGVASAQIREAHARVRDSIRRALNRSVAATERQSPNHHECKMVPEAVIDIVVNNKPWSIYAAEPFGAE